MIITFKKAKVFALCPFEALYEQELAEDFEGKTKLYEYSHAVNLYVDGELAGEIYGIRVGNMADLDIPYRDIWPYCQYESSRDDIYCFSTTILPQFQGKGLARLLKAYWMGVLRARGFERVVGHSTTPAMRHINLSLGAREVGRFDGWFGTKRTAHAYVMEIGG